MNKSLIVAFSILGAGAIGYIIYKKQVPPTFLVDDYSDSTAQGHFEWGKAAGPLGPGTLDGGWGWSLSMTQDAQSKKWMVSVFKNNTHYRDFAITGSGPYKI